MMKKEGDKTNNKKLLLLLSIILLLLSFVSVVQAATYYTDPSGSDSSGDGSSSSPWLTLSHACSQVRSPGNNIHINSGTYIDNNQCDLAIGVSIEGEGKNLVTINSDYSAPSFQGWYIKAWSPTLTDGNHKISGFTLKGGSSPTDRRLDHGIWVYYRNNVEIYDIKFMYIEDPDQAGGAIRISGHIPDGNMDNTIPPTFYVSNVSIHDCEFYDSARSFGSSEIGAIFIIAVNRFRFYNNIMDESNTNGFCLKGVPGWIKESSFYNNSFTVNSGGISRTWYLNFELWNLQKDTEIYNNTFNYGWVSLASGDKAGGDYALLFHDNILYNTMRSEFVLDDVRIYNNFFSGYMNLDGAGPGVGIWSSWANARTLENIEVFNNIFYNSRGFAISLVDPAIRIIADNISIFNNVIDTVQTWEKWNLKSGIFIQMYDSESTITNLSIRNNVLMNIPGDAVWASGGYVHQVNSPYVTHNHFFNNSNNVRLGGTTNPTISNNIEDTQQADIVGSGIRPFPYYYPSSSSADIVDAGTDVGLPYSGSAPDIGAYEYQSVQSSCSQADTNSDGVVSMTELMSYIADWKVGSVTMTQLMTAIGEWKNGC